MRPPIAVLLCVVPVLCLPSFGQDVGKAPPERTDEGSTAKATGRPIQALLVTGGCCHDYDRQKLILTRGVSARANVRWTVVHQGGKTTNTPIPLYDDPDWAEGFDIVVHNECFSDVKDLEFVDRILQPHKDGLPAILIHCAMHCYRVEDDRWFQFVGMQSPGHGPHYSYNADNVKPDHPIMANFGPMFVAPKGELYHSMKVFDTATPLAQANRQSDGMPQVCVWTNDYDGTRVFATTMGHYNETMAEPKYLDMMAKGLLWAVGKDPERDFTPSDDKIDDEIRELINVPLEKVATNYLPQNCCGDNNLAYKKPVTSKSEQDGNFRKHLTDGLLNTRWCANGSQVDEWVTVDLEEPKDVGAIRLHWEKREGIAYKYLVDVSADNKDWTTVVDASENEAVGGLRAHKVDAPGTRYIRVTFLGASQGVWGSIWELEASAGELPDLSNIIPADGAVPATISDVEAPPGFRVAMFGAPPEVNYPVCLTAAATGEVYIGVDEQGSLGKEPGRGKVLRCIDTDGDGTADQINEFARMDHPRGLVHDNNTLWVLHPPYLSVYRDTDGDGTADESEVLIEGISTDEVSKRGADHTTNGIRMGVDGWIYIAVGDFGFHHAVAKDGTTLSKRGGGIVRILPDGTEMEIYSWGQRNILDVSIDPYMNIFTRDNTNDGGGWDIRLTHILQTANYGYPSLYKNFTEESMPPLADYGGGSGCGSMYFQDARWPEPFNDMLLTCDWGTSEVYSHHLPQNGATYDAQQDTFLKLPRPTDIDVDGSGRMYVSSWKNGKFAYDGPDIGFVAQVVPAELTPHPVPQLDAANDQELVNLLRHPSATLRMAVQRALVRRNNAGMETLLKTLKENSLTADPSIDISPAGLDARIRALGADDSTPQRSISSRLERLCRLDGVPLYSRIAAVYTLKQVAGSAANPVLARLSVDEEIREHCIRAMTDRLSQMQDADFDLVLSALRDRNPRVRAVAIIGVQRLLNGVINHWNGRGEPPLNAAHVDKAAEMLLELTRPDAAGDRPASDAHGPEDQASASGDALPAVTGTVTIDGEPANGFVVRFSNNGRGKDGVVAADGTFRLTPDGSGEFQVSILPDVETQPVHADDWRNPHPERVIPHLAIKALVELDARDVCLKALNGPYREGALRALRAMHTPQTVSGLFAALSMAHDESLRREIWTALIRLYYREGEFTEDSPGWWGTRPDTTGPYYDRETWSESDRIGDAVRVALAEADESLASHIREQLKRHVVNIDGISDADLTATMQPEKAIELPKVDPGNPDQIANLSFEAIHSRAMAAEGNVDVGKLLFQSQSCANCHTFANGQQPRGPHLVDIGKRYRKEELIESIVDPSKKIAQGFDTWTFLTADGKTHTGFVVLQSAETVTIRQTDGLSKELRQDDIDDRVKQDISMMPKGVVGKLTPEQLADIISWLQTLH